MFSMPLKIDRCAKSVCSANWCWVNNPENQTGFNLWIVLAGEGTLQTAGATYDLRAGDGFLLRMWDRNIGAHNPERPLVVSWICFDCLDAKGRVLAPRQCPQPPEYRRIPDLSFLDQLLQRTIDWHSRGELDRAEPWLHVALLETMKYDGRSLLSGLDLEHAVKLDALCAQIQQQPERFLNIPQLAETTHCSVDHFIRLFKRYKGLTPWEFVIRCRVEKACNLLRFSSHTVAQVADLLGYADIYAFSKQFKSRTGRTPTAYRKRF